MVDPKEVQDRLADKQDTFDKASTSSGWTQEWPPDGTYQALVRKFDFFEAKDGGSLYLKTELDIAGSDYAGMTVEAIHQLDPLEGWRADALKTHMDRLGVDVTDLKVAELYPGSELLQGLLDVPVEIAVKTSDQLDKNGDPYKNLYVNKRLGDKVGSDVPADTEGLEQQPTAAAARAGRSDDDIPFARPLIPDGERVTWPTRWAGRGTDW